MDIQISLYNAYTHVIVLVTCIQCIIDYHVHYNVCIVNNLQDLNSISVLNYVMRQVSLASCLHTTGTQPVTYSTFQ